MNSDEEILCEGCEYYDRGEAVCMAFECYPISECDRLLPCEIEEEQK